MLRRSAVQSDRRSLRNAVQPARTHRNRRAVADVCRIAAGERKPRRDANLLFAQRTHNSACLDKTRQGLAGEQVGVRCSKNRETLRMKCGQRILVDAVVSPILGAVSKICPVRADRCRHERCTSACPVFRKIQIACLLCQVHGRLQECRGFLCAEPAFLKPLHGRLITCTRHHIGTGAQIVQVNLAHKIGPLKESLRRPESIIHRKTARLEFRRKRTVEHNHVLHGKTLFNDVQSGPSSICLLSHCGHFAGGSFPNHLR